MRIDTSFIWFFAFTLVICQGCSHSVPSGSQDGIGDSLGGQLPVKVCGMPDLVDVRSLTDVSMGVFEASNDSDRLYLTYAPGPGLELAGIDIYYGAIEQLPMDSKGRGEHSRFPIKEAGLSGHRPWSTSLPLKTLPECLYISAHITATSQGVTLEGWAGQGKDPLALPGLRYCRQRCTHMLQDCALQEKDHLPHTFPQGQWAAKANATDLALLRDHFSEVFPEGISVGCNVRVTFASLDEALATLPMDGPAQALPENLQPGNIPNNKLLGELLSLLVAMQMDEALPTFSPGSPPLGSLQVAVGAFEGWSVAEVANEANSTLGGCTSNYTPAQIHEVVWGINNDFAAGQGEHSFLRCRQD